MAMSPEERSMMIALMTNQAEMMNGLSVVLITLVGQNEVSQKLDASVQRIKVITKVAQHRWGLTKDDLPGDGT